MRYFLILAIFIATNTMAKDYWISKAGKKLAIGAKELSGSIFFEQDNLKEFCDLSEKYLGDYLRDYKYYRCDKDNDLSRTFCKILRKEFNRAALGNNTFGIELPQSFEFQFRINDSTNWEEVKEKVSKQYKYKKGDILVMQPGLTADGNWESKIKESNMFGKILNIVEMEKELYSTTAGSFIGTVRNRLMACALLTGSAQVKKEMSSETVIVDRIDKMKLSSYWDTYLLVKDEWPIIQERERKGAFQLLELGSLLKEKRSLNFVIKPKLSELFEVYFSIEDENIDLNIFLKEFYSINQFEEKQFPPKIYPIQFQTIISSEM